jgi:hypothetical protein
MAAKKSSGSAAVSPSNLVNRDEALAYYRDMLLIRRFEERAGQLYGMGLIAGFCHLYIGQEAVVVGMQAAQKAGDQVITGYRDHGHMLACGMSPREIMAELTGRIGGSSRGKGGSMHMFSKEANFYGGHGIVGAQVALGTGLALANRYRGNEQVSVAYFGDGAANQGQVYESFNMASLWRLPVDDFYTSKSSVADICNDSAGGWGGASVGAAFIKKFAGKTPWAHLDIAGVANIEKGCVGTPEGLTGATGFGVRLLVNWLLGSTPSPETAPASGKARRGRPRKAAATSPATAKPRVPGPRVLGADGQPRGRGRPRKVVA